MWFRNHLVNPVVRAVLRSPAHRLLSAAVLLLTYTGRRSGRRYTIPVQYARHDGRVVIWPAQPDRKRWWRNLRQPTPVELRIAGQQFQGTAQAITNDPAEIAADLGVYLQRFPRASSGLGLETSALPTPASLRSAAKQTVVVHVDLGPPTDTNAS
jgi:deazaflavin-dependent oxidoreductase (nitroreductase family)